MESASSEIQDTALSERAWSTTVPVRFPHCDPAGIVYFARYFDLINGVVEDWFCQELKVDYHEMIGPRRIGLGYVSAGAEFTTPSFMGDRLEFVIAVQRIGRSSVTLHIHAFRGSEPVLLARLIIVTTSLEIHQSIPLPDDLRLALECYQEKCR
jgi:acyl-CoA thioesterase FadM